MIIGEEIPPPVLRHCGLEESTGHLVLKQTIPVLGEGGGVERLVRDVEVKEPLEEEVVLEAFAELTLTSY